jgi:2-phospho-L-lactate guanylyltransferase
MNLSATTSMCVIIPVKPFGLAKQRLSPLLCASERRSLARAMFQDVLAAASSARGLLDGLLIVTSDPEAGELGRAAGAAVITDDPAEGINAAIELALDHLAARRPSGMMVLPADIPQISSHVVSALAAQMTAAPSITLVPATRDGGTNLLATRPAELLRPQFGADSFRRHCLAARQIGIEPTVPSWCAIGCDIDQPDDIATFMSLQTRTRTHQLLIELGIGTRLASQREIASHADLCCGEKA